MNNKSLLAFFIILMISTPRVWSQINYEHCSQFIKKTNGNVHKTGFSFPFELDKETGKIIRAILAQNKAAAETTSTKPTAFVWPKSKYK